MLVKGAPDIVLTQTGYVVYFGFWKKQTNVLYEKCAVAYWVDSYGSYKKNNHI